MLDEEKIKRKAERYRSHLPVLRMIIKEYNPLNIIEIGMGDNSTKFFLDVDFENLISVETDKEWIDRCDKEFGKKENHTVYHCKDDKPESFIRDEFDLGFVDGRPANKRGVCVNALIGKSDIIVFHDSEPEFRVGYGYSKIRMTDEYEMFDYTAKKPWTSVIIKKDLVTPELKQFFSK